MLSIITCVHDTLHSPSAQMVMSPAKQQQFSICTFSESFAARATDSADHKQVHRKEFNSLMQQYSADAGELELEDGCA